MSAEKGNTYLEQVVAQQAVLEGDLRSRRQSAPPSAPAPAWPGGGQAPAQGPLAKRERALGGTRAEQSVTAAIDVRISGFWRWKTVIVPPNAFVVHTRRGRSEPLHLGLGVSFRYNPATDSYLVVPGATQTILINAYCICRELQGVLVQGYVQWIIQDFATAYRKLDFSDLEDPMRLVNLQLREQAEAAIKDKVATMSVHDVLSDKQPIIEELTARLRAVAEGENNSDQGLGLRIVTVQIKEAVVSSARLWENLQKPFRTEQSKLARLAELQTEEVIAEREMTAERVKETRRIEHARELALLRARNDAERFDNESAEKLRRTHREHEDRRQVEELELETMLHALQLVRQRQAEQAETDRLRIEQEQRIKRLEQEAELALQNARAEAAHQRALLELEADRLRAAIANERTPAAIQADLVSALPEIVQRLPKPNEMRNVTIGGTDTSRLGGLLAELMGIVGALQNADGHDGAARSG